MINNRQGGRRRGRGGQRNQSQGGQPGNRQDNRQRGNAAQLLEKYKSMARDSQLAGDRVQTEYYLQFADHYFRVLSENRPRSEDQRPRRDDDDGDDEGDDEMGDNEMADAIDDRPERQERAERSERTERPMRRERPYRNDEDDRPRRNEAEDRPRRDDGEDRPRRRAEQPDESSVETRPVARADKPQRRPRANGSGDTLSLNVLPPAIGRGDDEHDSAAEEAPKPRRTRRVATPTESDDGAAPAA